MIPVLTPTANPLLTLRLTETKPVDQVPRYDSTSGVRLLTRGLAKGDETAFRQFHALYFDRLYEFLLVVARGQEDEAQEALQQTLLRVLRYAREFESDEAFWNWLKVLARSAARDAGRKHQRYTALLQAFAERGPGQNETGEGAEDQRLSNLLIECLEELDSADRRLIEGKYLDGDSVKELSAREGLTEKAVESRLVRLRRELRERLLNKLRVP